MSTTRKKRFSFNVIAALVLIVSLTLVNCGGGGGGGGGATAPTAPNAASVLLATAVSSAGINLAWTDGSSNEDGFKIERGTDGANFTQIGTVTANTTAYNDTGLTASTVYYYRVRANNSAGDSGYSNTANATTQASAIAAPAAPASLSALAASSTIINLSWTDSSSDEDEFKVERGTDGTTFSQIGAVTANTAAYSDSGLTASTIYYYRVRANNSAGDSGYSNTANATTQAPAIAAPAAPASLQATAESTSTISLSWTDASSNEDGFKIERGTDGTNFTQIGTVTANTTAYNDTGLTASTVYYYRVRANNSAGDSGYSNTANATTQAPAVAAPAAPASLQATAESTSTISLSWTDASSNEDGFKVERGTDGTNFTQIGTVAANRTAYSDSGLTDFTKYYYRVRATNNTAGDSAYSNTANATTLIVAYVVPFMSVSSTAFGTSRVDLAWGSHDITPTECNIYRSTAAGTLGTKVATQAGNDTDYQDTGLTPGTTYYYTIELVSDTWPSFKSAQAAVTTLTTATFPQLITGLTYAIVGRPYTIGAADVVLSWDPYQGAAMYEVKRTPYLDRVGQAQGPLFVGNPTTSTITDNTGPTDGTQYYSVRAHNAGFTQSSSWTTIAVTITSMRGVERPWLDLDNSKGDRTAFQLHWYGAPGATAHHVYASTNGSMITPKEGSSSPPLDGGDTQLPIVQTSPGRYKMEIPYNIFPSGSFQWIRIEATKKYLGFLGGDVWYDADSEEAVGLNIVAPQPVGVTGVSATPASPTAINVSWSAAVGADSYNIYRKSGTAASASLYAIIGTTTSLSYKDTFLTPKSDYTYLVRAVSGGVESAASNYAAGRTLSSAVPLVYPPILAWPGQAVLWWSSENAGTTFKIYGGGALLPTAIDPDNLVSSTILDPATGQSLWRYSASAPTEAYAAFTLSGGLTPVYGAYWITEVYPDGTESSKRSFTVFVFL